jgi:hypothetical protein
MTMVFPFVRRFAIRLTGPTTSARPGTRRRRGLHLESLEGRDVPANLTVTFAAGTLTVVGDATANDVTVAGDNASPTYFTLASGGTINNQPSPFSTPAGVKNLVFKMLAGDDSVTFDNTVAISVQGNVSIDGGDGANSVTATDLTVAKNLSIANGTAAAGNNSTNLINLSVGGNVTIKSAGGDTFTVFSRNSVGESNIKGYLTVTNGTGADVILLIDTSVGKNVAINNGHGSVGNSAGEVQIRNGMNSAFRSVIGGNLKVTNLDGNGGFDLLFDYEVLGNVTFNHGPGAFDTGFDGYATKLPVLIHGNLSVLGTGANSIEVAVNYKRTGLDVGKKFTLTSGGTAETVSLNKLQVGGNTSITLGNGGNTVTINDSIFGGNFTLISGAGADTFNVETTAGTTSATEFKKAALIDMGGGGDNFFLVDSGGPDAGQAIVCWSTFKLVGPLSGAYNPGNIYFPNGGSIQF